METIIITDDHPVTLNGMAAFLESEGYKILNMYTNGIAALNNILVQEPDFAIMDISMPGMTGLEALEKIRIVNKTQKVILYTMYHDTALFEKAKQLGVNGYVLKDFALEELLECLKQLRFRKQWFSPRLSENLKINVLPNNEKKLSNLSAAEQKIVAYIAKGKSSRQIAEQLFISEKTVENHRSNIVKKLGLQPGYNSLAIWAARQDFD